MNENMEMFSFHNRLESFEQWPHVECNCTPEKVLYLELFLLPFDRGFNNEISFDLKFEPCH